jgi:hypothetical protein
MPPPSVTALILSPSSLVLDRGGKSDLNAIAIDNNGIRVSVPNGTQVRVDDPLIATANLVGNLVHVTAIAAGSTKIRLTKGALTSNNATVDVRAGTTVPVLASIVVVVADSAPFVNTPVPVTAQLLDQTGVPLLAAGRMQHWTINGSAGALLNTSTSTTNGAGIATVTLIVSATPGAVQSVTCVDQVTGIAATSPLVVSIALPPPVPAAITISFPD